MGGRGQCDALALQAEGGPQHREGGALAGRAAGARLSSPLLVAEQLPQLDAVEIHGADAEVNQPPRPRMAAQKSRALMSSVYCVVTMARVEFGGPPHEQ